MQQGLRFLIIGDVVGQTGQIMFQKHAARLKKEHMLDGIIVNGENSAYNGRGISEKQIKFFQHNGADVITSGNHIWGQRDSYGAIDKFSDVLIRPANFPSVCPGKGYALVDIAGTLVGVINVQGRVFMGQHLDCPFRAVESLLTFVRSKTNIIFIDIHAEATSEKKAMGFFLDGKVSCVFGTHTHVQIADEMILPGGTGYITDLGFCGALNSSLGMQSEQILQNFLTQMPQRFKIEKHGPYVLNGIIVAVDGETGETTSIERVRVVDDEAHRQFVETKKG